MTSLDFAEIPQHVSADRVYDFDIFRDEGLLADPYARFDELVESAPSLFWTPRNGGHWVVTGYDGVVEAYRNFEIFGNLTYGIPAPKVLPEKLALIPSQMDPPEHGPYRRVIDRLITPKVVASMEAEIRSFCIQLIEGFVEDGRCEFMSQFALPLPVLIFCRRMGLPEERYRELSVLASNYTQGRTNEERDEAYATIRNFLRELLIARETQPQDDWLTRLLHSEMDGERLDRDDVVLPMAVTVFFGGLDTVKNGLGQFMNLLAQRKDLQEQLRDPELDKGAAAEELLRFLAVLNQQRLVRRDADFMGARIKKGEMVHICGATAGLDESANPSAHTVDFSRKNIKHTVFGVGRHFCAGAGLARLEMKIFLEEWFRKIPAFTLGDKPVVRTAGIVNAVQELHISW